MDLVGTVLSAAQTLISAMQSTAFQEVISILGYETRLKELRDTVETINGVLRDAETVNELSQQDQIYIQNLRDAVFEADDLFDEFVTLAELKLLRKCDGSISKKVSSFFSLSSNPLGLACKMSHGVKDMRNKLKTIVDNSQFSFKIDPQPIRKRSRETCSYVHQVEIIGRRRDLDNIVGTLLASDDHQKSNNNVSVLSIVGMGGLGKTALAQLVYNDSRVTNAFSLKLWTCVADQDQKVLDVRDILAKILGGDQHGLTLEHVQSKLRAKLAGKKFLLVLDDVWTENRDLWLELEKYLIGGTRGSYVVVTTRSQNTATITGGLMYGLPGLSKENSWHLFEKTAFTSEQLSSPHEELVQIGEKIVDGCAGVPLATRVAGSLLYGQDKYKWMNIRDIGLADIRHADNGILPIIELSFHHLETPLKNCFRYCALFPKDYEMKKEVLLRLWIAQGYIVELDKGQSIEKAAEEYFAILLKRCFFQDIKKNRCGDIHSCKIHDLMHDIAKKVSGKEINAWDDISGKVVYKNVRHLSISNTSEFENYPSFENTHIRSLLSFDHGDRHCQLKVDDLVKSFRRLRVLDLSYKNIKCLPDSIGDLLHLRYIDLSCNEEMKVLPNSVTKLCNLQTLLLYRCFKLKELPKDLSRLVKLRVLDIERCFRLRWMPRGMGMLTSLQTLKGDYIVGGEGRCKSWKQWLDGLKDLKSLTNLKGQLGILIKWPEKNAKNDVQEDNLREGLYLSSLVHLDNLQLKFKGDGDSGIGMRVMEKLHPHPKLERLFISKYNGVKMAGWLTLIPNLVKLYLEQCEELKYLSCLGSLRHLKSQILSRLPKLEYIIAEEDGRASASTKKVSLYPSLEELVLSQLPKLKGWRKGVDLQVVQPTLPQLKKLTMSCCSEFSCTLPCPMLETLHLRGFNEGMKIVCTKTNVEESSKGAAIENPVGGTHHHIPKLRELVVDNGAWLDSMPIESFSSLQTMWIKHDHEMEELPDNLQYLSALQTLKIVECENLKAMPNWMPKLTSLKKLIICNSSESLKEGCQKDPLIQHIPRINFRPFKG